MSLPVLVEPDTARFYGNNTLNNRLTTLEKPKAGCVYDLETTISYSDGGSNFNYLGEAPNWISTYD